MKWKPTQFLNSNGSRYGVPTYDKVVASAGNYNLWVEGSTVKENPFITVDNKFLTKETFTSTDDAMRDGKIKDDVPAYRISRKGGHAGDVMGSKLITVDATKPQSLLDLVYDANEQTKKAYNNDPSKYNGRLVELNKSQAKMISKVIQYAFKQQPAGAPNSKEYYKGQAHFLATQVLIWEIQEGKRLGWGNDTGYVSTFRSDSTAPIDYETSGNGYGYHATKYHVTKNANDSAYYRNALDNYSTRSSAIKNAYNYSGNAGYVGVGYQFYWHDYWYSAYNRCIKNYYKDIPDYYAEILRSCELADKPLYYSVNGADNPATISPTSPSSARAWNLNDDGNNNYSGTLKVSPELMGTSNEQYNPNHLMIPVQKINVNFRSKTNGEYPQITLRNEGVGTKQYPAPNTSYYFNEFRNGTVRFLGVSLDKQWYYVQHPSSENNPDRGEYYININNISPTLAAYIKDNVKPACDVTYQYNPGKSGQFNIKTSTAMLNNSTEELTFRWTRERPPAIYNNCVGFRGNGAKDSGGNSYGNDRVYITSGNVNPETVFFKYRPPFVRVSLRAYIEDTGQYDNEIIDVCVPEGHTMSFTGKGTMGKDAYNKFVNDMNTKYPYDNTDTTTNTYDFVNWGYGWYDPDILKEKNAAYTTYINQDYGCWVGFTLNLKAKPIRTIYFYCNHPLCKEKTEEERYIGQVIGCAGQKVTIPDYSLNGHSHPSDSTYDSKFSFWGYPKLLGQADAGFKSGDTMLIGALNYNKYYANYKYSLKQKDVSVNYYIDGYDYMYDNSLYIDSFGGSNLWMDNILSDCISGDDDFPLFRENHAFYVPNAPEKTPLLEFFKEYQKNTGKDINYTDKLGNHYYLQASNDENRMYDFLFSVPEAEYNVPLDNVNLTFAAYTPQRGVTKQYLEELRDSSDGNDFASQLIKGFCDALLEEDPDSITGHFSDLTTPGNEAAAICDDEYYATYLPINDVIITTHGLPIEERDNFYAALYSQITGESIEPQVKYLETENGYDGTRYIFNEAFSGQLNDLYFSPEDIGGGYELVKTTTLNEMNYGDDYDIIDNAENDYDKDTGRFCFKANPQISADSTKPLYIDFYFAPAIKDYTVTTDFADTFAPLNNTDKPNSSLVDNANFLLNYDLEYSVTNSYGTELVAIELPKDLIDEINKEIATGTTDKISISKNYGDSNNYSAYTITLERKAINNFGEQKQGDFVINIAFNGWMADTLSVNLTYNMEAVEGLYNVAVPDNMMYPYTISEFALDRPNWYDKLSNTDKSDWFECFEKYEYTHTVSTKLGNTHIGLFQIPTLQTGVYTQFVYGDSGEIINIFDRAETLWTEDYKFTNNQNPLQITDITFDVILNDCDNGNLFTTLLQLFTENIFPYFTVEYYPTYSATGNGTNERPVIGKTSSSQTLEFVPEYNIVKDLYQQKYNSFTYCPDGNPENTMYLDTGKVLSLQSNEDLELLFWSVLEHTSAPNNPIADNSGYLFVKFYEEIPPEPEPPVDPEEPDGPDSPDFDFDVEFKQPNAGYKFDTTVVSTFMVDNHSAKEYTDFAPLNTTFDAFANCEVDGVKSQIQLYTTTKNVVCPGEVNNIFYYRWTVPAEDTIKQLVSEKTGVSSDKVIITGFDVKATVVDSDTDYTKTDTGRVVADWLTKSLVPKSGYDLYGGKNFNYSDPSSNREYHNTASWQEYVCNNGEFELLTNKAKIDFRHNLLRPDELASTQYTQDGQWFTRSGYALRTEVTTSSAVDSDSDYITSQSMTPVQTAEVYFPEFNYSRVENEFEAMILDKTNNMFIFRDVENANTIRPRHYVPIWFPDRDYITQTYVSDAWCPVGMLTYFGESNPVGINGSLFDDYGTQQKVW